MAAEQTELAVVGENLVVGRALETLLQSLGYSTRFFRQRDVEEVGARLSSCRLVLVVPPLSEERRMALREVMLAEQTSVNVPILELSPANGERNIRREEVLPWPCSTDELRRAVDTILTT